MLTNKTRFTGIIPPIITPMTEKRELDREALKRLIDFDIQGGVSGIFTMGSSGEAMMTSRKVWLDTAKACVEIVGNRAQLFCGVIDASTVRVIENIKMAEDTGVTAMVVTPAFYLQNCCQDEICRHYEAVAGSTRQNIVVYNIPCMTHVNIEPETAKKIAQIDNVVAMKDSSNDWERFERFLFELESEDIALFNGAEELCSAALIYGAQGCVPGLANFFPRLFVDLYKACKSGNVKEAYRLQKECWIVRKALSAGAHWMSAMKYIGFRMGFGANVESDPVQPLTAEQMKKIDGIIEPFIER